MAQPVLVVDIGADATAAALVVGERAALVRDPVSGADVWPSALGLDSGMYLAGSAAERIRFGQPRMVFDGLRRALDTERPVRLGGTELAPTAALAAYLASLRAEALRMCTDEVDRLTLTVPTGYGVPDRRRDQLIAAGEAAGFRDVELLDEVSAAILGARSNVAVPAGALLLVCDLGDSWKTTLVHADGPQTATLGHEIAPYGRELDSMLLDDLRSQARDWIEPVLDAHGDIGLLAQYEVTTFLRQLKHRVVAQAGDAAGSLREDLPPYQLHRDWLDRLAEPGLRWVVASARSLIARASAHGSAAVRSGSAMADVAAVVLVGGCARLGVAEHLLHNGLQRPVLRLPEPELAIVRGGVRWVAAAASRRIQAEHPRWRVEPLSWAVPGGRARLVRWSVAEGEAYRRGAVVAQVRTTDERVFDLAAPEEGTLLSHRARVGDIVGPTLVAMAKRPASCLAGDPPGFRQQLSAAGEWLLLAERQVLVECGANARHVRLWSISDGVPVAEFVPGLDANQPHQGRVFVDPGGRLSLVAWNPAGLFSVWDVRAGRMVASFRDSNPPATVMVNEGQWRLTVEGEDATSAGRYRRTVATVWDLATGQKLERLSDDWQRRLPGYGTRSAVDAFGERALSPDGLLCAVSVQTPGGAAIALQESGSDHEVFRAEQPSRTARTAFTADGRFLLANWESDQRSQVDVWEL